MRPVTNKDEILKVFSELSEIPRISGNEKEVVKWLIKWANENHFEYKQDEIGNIVITIPATEGYENKSGYILQGHMDMVGQKTEDSNHDFNKDPIVPVIKEEWLKTNGETTLGADNGIAIAMAMTLAISDAPHPILELLFTVDEETGLTGALQLGEDMLTQKALINLDSEDMGYITIGCAGSGNVNIKKSYKTIETSGNSKFARISIKNGNGGHSGVEIYKKIANSNVLLARLLKKIELQQDVNLVNISGGSVRNAISRSSDATISYVNFGELSKITEDFKNVVLEGEYGNVEKGLLLEIEELDKRFETQFTLEDTREIIATMLTIPHGVLGMSNEVEGLVETSNNFAIVKGDVSRNEGNLEYITMHRSLIESRISEVTDKLESIAVMIGADFEISGKTPTWQPNPYSNLVKQVASKYEEIFKEKPVIEAIHAGLECGVIGEKFEGMEMVSFGPTIKGAHTPEERLLIEDINKIMVWLEAILAG